jgi:hypothetical protein
MPQHIWTADHAHRRHCDVCEVHQRWNSRGGMWMPEVSAICPGDDEDSGISASPRSPLSPDNRRPVLDDA